MTEAGIKVMVSRRSLIAAGSLLLLPSGLRAAGTTPNFVIDTEDAPSLEAWGQELRRRAVSWWPLVAGALASPGYRPPENVYIKFRNDLPQGLAGHTVGNIIALNAPYITAHPTYYNYVGHELVHVVQDYKPPFIPWLVEGVADYVRYYVLFPQDPERRLNPAAGDYRRGYQQAAALLDWIERTHGVGSVRRANAAMRTGENGEAVLAKDAGRPLDDVWTDVVASLTDGSPIPQA